MATPLLQQGSYGSWNFRISFSRPGKSWNVGHGKSWKMMFIQKVQNNFFVCLFCFCEENSKSKPKMKDDFQENGQI